MPLCALFPGSTPAPCVSVCVRVYMERVRVSMVRGTKTHPPPARTSAFGVHEVAPSIPTTEELCVCCGAESESSGAH